MSPVELGTIEFPYKDFDSIITELINFHTNEDDRNIHIYVMEHSVNFWLISNTYFSNITSVTISTYSEVKSGVGKANFEGIDRDSKKIAPGMPTLFSILSKVFKY